MGEREEALESYVRERLHWRTRRPDRNARSETERRIKNVFSSLPKKALDLFLSGARNLAIEVEEDPVLPLGMRTGSEGPAETRYYTIRLHEEELGWPENLFIGALLRELGHVVAERPPEAEWPTSRAERARFKERMESRADAMVWRWGLRHYSMVHLSATYPAHRVDDIVADITRVLFEEGDDY